MVGYYDGSLAEALAMHDVFKSRWTDVELVIMKNIPKEFTVLKVLQMLLRTDGIVDNMEFIYAPCVPNSQMIRGFAFLKFTSVSSAMDCRERFHGRVVKNHAQNGPLVIEPGSSMPIDMNGRMFCECADPAMQPVYMNDPEMQEAIATYRRRRLRRKKGYEAPEE
eukprot:TRINITY_DN41215_c0_g1_i1.p1 TRINITY_DN41215_c0_g1~~TRINITY_DN41215_c0_g1_i1.p1  ORF type:complete len:165 (+),score=27.76 TRINITY_DN41215_c0_g1_i1:104-598(+)